MPRQVLPSLPDDDALDDAVLLDQLRSARAVDDLDPLAFGNRAELVDEPRPAAGDLDRQPAPELEAAIDLERLMTVGGVEADALRCIQTMVSRLLSIISADQVGVGAVLGQPLHVLEELLAGVGAEVGVDLLVLIKIRDDTDEVIEVLVDEADHPAGEAAVAATQLLRRPLEDGDARALLACRQAPRTTPRSPRRRQSHPSRSLPSLPILPCPALVSWPVRSYRVIGNIAFDTLNVGTMTTASLTQLLAARNCRVSWPDGAGRSGARSGWR